MKTLKTNVNIIDPTNSFKHAFYIDFDRAHDDIITMLFIY